MSIWCCFDSRVCYSSVVWCLVDSGGLFVVAILVWFSVVFALEGFAVGLYSGLYVVWCEVAVVYMFRSVVYF